MTYPEDEPQFVRQVAIGVPEKPRLSISFRIRSRAQVHSNPQEWYKSVSEMWEDEDRESPIFVLTADSAAELAQNLLKAVEDSRAAYDAVD